jgi:hypothetical protein
MSDKIHYEMTGALRSSGYSTKSDMIKHLEGYGTSPDDACELLLTDSYDSKSSKMYKAQKQGIRILTYEDLMKEL